MKKILIILLFCFLGVTSLFAESYSEFKKNILNEYVTYKQTLQKEFDEYRKTLDEEYKKYIKEISKYWNDKKVSNKKVYVEYSEDKKKRKIVDYEHDKLIIEVKPDKKDANKKKYDELIKKILIETLKEDLRTAYKRDQVSVNVENKLKGKTKTTVSSKIPKTKVLSPYLTTKEDIKKIKEATKAAKVKKYVDKGKPTYRFEIKLPSKKLSKKVSFVKDYVFENSTKHRLKPEVIFSIIHNESSFNPMAKSYVPAYGLMQIVPKTAGADATKFLFGKPKILMPSYLYNPENNIKIGTAYFRILYYSYLKKIKNPISRLYCSIAAYNTGAGNVAKAFTGKYNINVAAKVINRMSPDDVYRTLKRKLPYDETKRYLDKVLDKMKLYKTVS